MFQPIPHTELDLRWRAAKSRRDRGHGDGEEGLDERGPAEHENWAGLVRSGASRGTDGGGASLLTDFGMSVNPAEQIRIHGDLHRFGSHDGIVPPVSCGVNC